MAKVLEIKGVVQKIGGTKINPLVFMGFSHHMFCSNGKNSNFEVNREPRILGHVELGMTWQERVGGERGESPEDRRSNFARRRYVRWQPWMFINRAVELLGYQVR